MFSVDHKNVKKIITQHNYCKVTFDINPMREYGTVLEKMSRSFVIAIPSINNYFSCKWYHNVRFSSALYDSLLKQPLSSFTTVRKQQQQQLYPSKKFVDSTTIRFNSGNEKGNHDLFLKQMIDLKQEQEEIFGVSNNDNDDDNITTATTTTDDNNDDLIQLAQKAQALELQQHHKSMESDEDWEARSEEREAIYNFSQDEKDAWSTTTTTNNNNNSNGEKKLSSSLMESIQKAREAQIIYENEQKQITNQKRQSWIQDTVSKYDNMSDLQSQQQTSSNGHNIESNNHTLFTHLNKSGETVSMVDVGAKVVTRRIARARSIVVFPPEVMEAFQFVTPSNENKETEIIGPKGPIFATAKIAGIMGAK